MPAREERKLVTVLFADLVGSTSLASDEDPERVRIRLERFYDAMAEEIERTGGTIEKFAGDAVMAVFGAPAALEDHAERALHAALAMQRRMRELFGGELEMRVGVNTGEVVAGAPREGSSFVTGDAVNVADRLQKAAGPGEVLAGERTVAAAAGAFTFSEPRTIDAKGKSDGIEGSTVQRALRTMRPRGVGGLRRVFVGRDSELDLLRATYRRAATQSEPHLVTIVGEPGVGKSRLVRELWDALASEEPAPISRTGRCLAYGAGITYWPLGEMVREHFGLREGAPVDEVSARLEGREILGLSLGLDVALDLHPLDARERLHTAAVAFVEEIASAQPAVLFVEDIHWAEPDLLDLLERLVSDVRASVVLVATSRPEVLDLRPTWGAGKRNAAVLWLDPLPAAAASQMLDEMLAAVLPDELRDLVVERADGNPFFLEELVGELVESGVLVRSEGGWALGPQDAHFAMPDTVHAVLAARIDRLPPTEKAALQAGSVVGRVFWTTPVVHLLDGEEPDFDLLEERDLIRSRRGSTIAGEREYAIKHALTREVAYASIPKARRGRLHADLADWLERSELARDDLASLLAYHYSEAVKPADADLVWVDAAGELERLRGRAVHWLTRAGELAQGRYEMDDAVELFTRAAALADVPRAEAELWCAVGMANALRYDGTGFWDAMLRGLALDALDPVAEANAYSHLAFQTAIRSGMWLKRPDLSPLSGWIERALELAKPETSARARALLARAYSDYFSSDAIEASKLADRIGDLELRSYALAARAAGAFVEADYERAAALSENRLQLTRGVADPDHLCEAYESGIPIAVSVGRFEEAHQLAALHAEMSARLSPHHRMHSAAVRIEIAENVGDWDDARSGSNEAIAAAQANAGTPCIRNARTLMACAVGFAASGSQADADALLTRTAEFVGEGWDGYLDPLRLRLALVREDRADAQRLVSSGFERDFVFGPSVLATRLDGLAALRLADVVEVEAPALLRPRTYIEPFALRALGIVRRDNALIAKALERFAALGLHWHAAQTERLLDWPG